MRIGRRRKRHASITAVKRSWPVSCATRANSTMRMAFLQARPTSTTKPTCVRMLLSRRRRLTPVMAQSKHMGTIRMTARGIDQFSYSAASIRKTSSTHRGNTKRATLPALICWYARSVHSNPMLLGSTCLARRSMVAMACPELTPGRVSPLMNMVSRSRIPRRVRSSPCCRLAARKVIASACLSKS